MTEVYHWYIVLLEFNSTSILQAETFNLLIGTFEKKNYLICITLHSHYYVLINVSIQYSILYMRFTYATSINDLSLEEWLNDP